MRTGMVLSYNKEVKNGFIKDLNGQKIRFHNEDGSIVFGIGDMVQFKIGVVKNRPLAVNVSLVYRNQNKSWSGN